MVAVSLADVVPLLGLALVVLIAKSIYRAVYDAYFGPFSKIPGPKFAAVSGIPLMIRVWRGDRWKWLQRELVPKYGKILQIAPKIVLISDRSEIKRIIVSEDWPKGDRAKKLRRNPERESLFTATTKEFHRARRRMLSPAFSIKFMASLEPLMAECIRDLVERIHDDIKTQPSVINICQLLNYLSLDIIGATSFGGTFNLVKTGYHPLPTNIHKELYVRILRGAFPPLKYVMDFPAFNDEFVGNIIKKRRQNEGPPPKDILQLILEAHDDGVGLSDEDTLDQLFEFIIAGSDTTSFSMMTVIIQLTKHPEKMKRLVEELDVALKGLRPHEMPSHETLKRHVPYLDACINETMRIWPISIEGGPPRVAESDVVVCGHCFPKGTLFYSNFYYLHHSAELWGEDVGEFRPERWLEPGKIPVDAFYPFSAGSRNCIGNNFAKMEMRILLATLFYRFNVEEVPGQKEDGFVQYITPRFPNHLYNMCISPRTLC